MWSERITSIIFIQRKGSVGSSPGATASHRQKFPGEIIGRISLSSSSSGGDASVVSGREPGNRSTPSADS